MKQISIQADSSQHEILIARLYELGVENFLEEDDILKCFVEESDNSDEIVQASKELISELNLTCEIIDLENKDWNKEWESNFAPILLDPDLYIYADFHPKISHVKHSILIAPKMAFGTGHHSTTSMILKWMIKNDFQNKSVLDFGSGTGILGIYAYLKGCSDLVMIDNDPNAVENAIEHCSLNHAIAINLLGSVEQIPNRKFDIIFANITRNVLEFSLPVLKNHLNPQGFIIISGFLKSDEEFMKQLISSIEMNVIESDQDLDWLSMVLQ